MDGQAQDQTSKIPFKSGTETVIANLSGAKTSFKIEGMRLVVSSLGSSMSWEFLGCVEHCVVYGKNPEEIRDPTHYPYKRAQQKNENSPSAFLHYGKDMIDRQDMVIFRAGSRHLALKPIKKLPVYKWGYELPSTSQAQLKDLWARFEAEKQPPKRLDGGGVIFKYGYWDTTPTLLDLDGRSYTTDVGTCTTKPGEYFYVPGIDDYAALCIRIQASYNPPPRGKGKDWYRADDWHLFWEQYSDHVTKISFALLPDASVASMDDLTIHDFKDQQTLDFGGLPLRQLHLSNKKDFVVVLKIDDKISSRYVAIELVSAAKDKIVHKWRVQRIANKTAIAEIERQGAKRETGIRSAKVRAGKKFYAAGVNFWWTVTENGLLLEHETVLPSIGELKFALLDEGELQNLNGTPPDSLEELGSEPVAVPLNKTALFVATKGSIAIRPVRVENGGKVVRDDEEIVTKNIEYERRIIRHAELASAAQGGVASNR